MGTQQINFTTEAHACCLVWQLTSAAQASISASELSALHAELESCRLLVGAETIELNGTHGALVCKVDEDAGEDKMPDVATPADAAVRLGQLLCRWALGRDPHVALRVGVHAGEVHMMSLPGKLKQSVYFGPGLGIARQLAETAPKDGCVHLLQSTKQCLQVLERMPFSVTAPQGSATRTLAPMRVAFADHHVSVSYRSYYLEADAEHEESDDDEEEGEESPRSPYKDGMKRASVLARRTIAGGGTAAVMAMSLDQFKQFLEEHHVDTSKFGKGQAKSVASLHKELVEQRSYLQLRDDQLERTMEIVRLTLCVQDSTGSEKVLLLSNVTLEDGRVRACSMKPAAIVVEGEMWQDAVIKKFEKAFSISREVQEKVFTMEKTWFKQDRTMSPSFPGLHTTYLTHEVRVKVQDPDCQDPKAWQVLQELTNIGMPDLTFFTTQSEDTGEKTKGWAWVDAFERDGGDAASLLRLLESHRIQVSEFKPGAFEELLEQVYVSKSSTLSARGSELLRHVAIIKVWVTADILSVPHVLQVVWESRRRGDQESRPQPRDGQPVVRTLRADETWREAIGLTLEQRLGIGELLREGRVKIDEASYKQREELEYSRTFPGLKTLYAIHEVTCFLLGTEPRLGLPQGNDFHVSRVARTTAGHEDLVITTCYTWMPNAAAKRQSTGVRQPPVTGSKRQLPPPGDAKVPGMNRLNSSLSKKAENVLEVQELMRGRKTDWSRAMNAAKRIRDKDYDCGQFYEDCVAAFPELSLYVSSAGDAATSSGRSAGDEYQRTLGALFAVYWLMRVDLDGADAFCYGVDDQWQTFSPADSALTEADRRTAFREGMEWRLLQDVFMSAGMLEADTFGNPSGDHDEERTLAMLVLTAIHDIMKVQALLPVVDKEHKEFCGFKAGETIVDHDLALGYVLEHYPSALPSFDGLPAAQKRSLKFTQCSMEYNMGWLVQAEAPPGALFRKFRAVIASGQASPTDIAFYFVHWLTDLAGAEPFPQDGCEKFVLKFPLAVLRAFLNSFRFITLLGSQTETEVFEGYLRWRWASQDPTLGAHPEGPGSVARLRILVMAQAAGRRMLEAYGELPAEDRTVLDAELARTGVDGQAYQCEGPEGRAASSGGPALLAYYGPALLQKPRASLPEAQAALVVLAEVFRAARELWPVQDSAAGETVIVQLDAIKDLVGAAFLELSAGEIWVLQRTSGRTAQVKKVHILPSGPAAPLGAPAAEGAVVDWSQMRALGFEAAIRRAKEQSQNPELTL